MMQLELSQNLNSIARIKFKDQVVPPAPSPTLGDEMFINSDFNDATGLTLSAGFSVSGGQLINDGSGANYSSARRNITFVDGSTYRVEVNFATLPNLAKCGVRFGANTYTKWSSLGITAEVNSFDFVANANSSGLFRLYGMNGYAFTYNSVSIKEVL